MSSGDYFQRIDVLASSPKWSSTIIYDNNMFVMSFLVCYCFTCVFVPSTLPFP